jgi:hypothetical protein
MFKRLTPRLGQEGLQVIAKGETSKHFLTNKNYLTRNI